MMNQPSRPRYVRCINNQAYVGYKDQPPPTYLLSTLIVGQIYKVALPEANDGDLLRVINETGQDYLYPARYFEPLTVNNDQVTETVTVHVPAWLKSVLHAEALADNRSMSAQGPGMAHRTPRPARIGGG